MRFIFYTATNAPIPFTSNNQNLTITCNENSNVDKFEIIICVNRESKKLHVGVGTFSSRQSKIVID